jgi:hypothetical protein
MNLFMAINESEIINNIAPNNTQRTGKEDWTASKPIAVIVIK